MTKKFVDPYYQGGSKLNYTFDPEKNQITSVPVEGWEPEHDATERAWEEIRSELLETLRLVKAGILSPLAYHMKSRMMDVALLSKEAGFWSFSTRRHLKAAVWKNLSTEKKTRYAVALGFSLEQLEQLPQEMA